ncbi:MAG: sodium:proton antiporter [Piscinibacter sp.]|uniref:sodium:proton antiporter n=1 Tax=Piscinibacter sp. TaxID=1903157 RepID=UPI001B44A97A|nr:sodium:proton antiporter [Piscinibacter sp.]MBP5989124.1 sodium:proton antiporter [Piscinibacter sp.]MBP6026156.1 sodium:proton antiporter [Piscinibacter sp.]
MNARRFAALAAMLLVSGSAAAAEVDGAALAAWWGVPFAGMLLSIALMPLLAPKVWHHHYGKIAAGWALAFMVPYALAFGAGAAGGALVHALVAEYLPFIILLTALFTAAGGIYIRGNLHGSPVLNTGLMAIGAVLASLMGTTGASMLLIRPLIRANDNRKHVVHVVVFFIFIVSNAGGSLTPLGDPPLFLGFLKGVDFFWTVQHIFPETLFLVGTLLALFFAIDSYWYRKEGVLPQDPTPDTRKFGIDGGINFLPLLAVVALVLMSGTWKPGIVFDVFGTPVELQQLARDAGLIVVTLVSLAITPKRVRDDNEFSWAPMQEVAKLFIGIFLTMIPVLAMLKAGEAGAFAAVTRAVTGADGQPLPWAYFWFSGLLSSFLDNAPTYLVFFNLAGGDPQVLMTTLASTLAAVSAGSVFMGANTYIGNAPNFMVKAIAEDRGIRMPSFFGYMAWSCGILIPLFVVMTFVWFR